MKVLIVVAFLVSFFNAYAQDSTKANLIQNKYFRSIQLTMENGAMLGNGTEFSDQIVNSSYYNGIDFRYGWSKLNSENTYNSVYRYPTLGIGYYSSTFHNANIGEPNALYFFFTMPLSFNSTRRWAGSYIGAFGLSYNFNAFDEMDNPTNLFVGSYRNCYLHMGYNLSYHLNTKFTAFGSIGFKHFSNGSFRQPNYGINLFPLSLGVKYKFNEKPLEKPVAALAPYVSHNQWNIMMAVGSKNYIHGDPNYFKATVGLNYLRQISYKYRMGVGMDLFYSGGYSKRNPGFKADFSNTVSYALVGSWEWVINKVVYVPIGLAYYLHHNTKNGEEANYYERVGLRFRLNEHYNVGITIKAHGGSADMFEWTFAYTFHKDPNKYNVR